MILWWDSSHFENSTPVCGSRSQRETSDILSEIADGIGLNQFCLHEMGEDEQEVLFFVGSRHVGLFR